MKNDRVMSLAMVLEEVRVVCYILHNVKNDRVMSLAIVLEVVRVVCSYTPQSEQ